MKAQSKFISGREKAKVVSGFAHTRWHTDGAAIEFVDQVFVHGKGSARLAVSMSKEEALDLAMGLLKVVRG